MSISKLKLNPGLKRFVGEDCVKRQRLGSEEQTQPSTHLEILPLEILEMAAEHLTNREDLKRFSEISAITKTAVLNVINTDNERLAVNELKVLGEWNSPKPEHSLSVIDFYKKCFADIRDYRQFQQDMMPIDDGKLETLKQRLAAVATNHVVNKSRAFKRECYADIISGRASIESIDHKYASLKCKVVSEALEHIISSTVNPEKTRGWVVRKATEHGHSEIVKVLLENGVISEEDRGWAVKDAAEHGHLEIVKVLLANGVISEDDRGRAVSRAAYKGHLEIVKALLANGVIFGDHRSLAVINAAYKGHLEIVKALLVKGVIFAHIRGQAVGYAAYKGHLEIVKVLLVNGAISEKDRGLAVKDGAQQGHFEIVKFLLENGAVISEEDRVEAITVALQRGYQATVDFLRTNSADT